MNRTVTILAARFWPDRHGGVETRLWHTARGLAQRGFEVTVLTENRTDAPPRQTVMPGLDIVRFTRMQPGRLWRWANLVRLTWWRKHLTRHLPKRGWIWASEPLCALAVILLGQRRRLIYNPAACTAGMQHIGHVHPHVHTMQMRRSVLWIDRLVYRLAGRVVVSSHNLKRQYERFFGARCDIAVVPLGGDSGANACSRERARMKWNIARDALTIGFVGRFDPCKGLDRLFEAFAAQPRMPSTRLLMVGDGPDEARLRALAESLRIAPQIIWAGRVDDPGEALAAIDAAAMPSIYEAFGIAALEAMAAGVPVIGSRPDEQRVLSAFDEIIDPDRTGWLVSPLDGRAFARLITQLEHRPQLCRTLGEAARQHARANSWGHYVERLVPIFTGKRTPSPEQSEHRRAA